MLNKEIEIQKKEQADKIQLTIKEFQGTVNELNKQNETQNKNAQDKIDAINRQS